MGKSRLEAFSDGVLAIIITIMVLGVFCWILWGQPTAWIKTGVATRALMILIYVKLLFTGWRRESHA